MSSILEALLNTLQSFPPEGIGLLIFLLCASAILLMLRFFGVAGVLTYISIAVIAANIQVLKSVQFSFFDFPIALGTVVFCSIFLATDILTEHFGPNFAKKGVWISFASMLLMTLLMFLTLGFKPAVNYTEGALSAHEAIKEIFFPAPALFIASLLAYLLSQYTDIWIFQGIKKLTGQRFLWLRGSLSLLAAALVDTILFSTLAWKVFGLKPMSLEKLIYTYILGTYVLRVGVSVMNMPILYFSKYFVYSQKGSNVFSV